MSMCIKWQLAGLFHLHITAARMHRRIMTGHRDVSIRTKSKQFMCKLGKSTAETLYSMQIVYGGKALKNRFVLYQCYKCGLDSLKDPLPSVSRRCQPFETSKVKDIVLCELTGHSSGCRIVSTSCG